LRESEIDPVPMPGVSRLVEALPRVIGGTLAIATPGTE